MEPEVTVVDEERPVDAASLRAEADRLEGQLAETAGSVLGKATATGAGNPDRVELDTLEALRKGDWYGNASVAERNPFGAAADASRVIDQARDNQESMTRIRQRMEDVLARGLTQIEQLRSAADALDRGEQVDTDHLRTLLSPDA